MVTAIAEKAMGAESLRQLVASPKADTKAKLE
jgi:hypothetical protein